MSLDRHGLEVSIDAGRELEAGDGGHLVNGDGHLDHTLVHTHFESEVEEGIGSTESHTMNTFAGLHSVNGPVPGVGTLTTGRLPGRYSKNTSGKAARTTGGRLLASSLPEDGGAGALNTRSVRG